MERSTTVLRKLLAQQSLIVAPGAYDPYTARLIESLGFSAVYLGGNAMGSHLVVGEPLMTLTETVDCAARVLRAIKVPLIVDADAGFGDPVHTCRAVEEFERVGVAAIHIEDQPFPKRAHYHKGKGRAIELNAVLDKLKAALDARRDPDFVIIGRTDIFRLTRDIDQVMERLAAYREIGVDVLMPLGVGPAEMRVIGQKFSDVPMLFLTGAYPGEHSTREVADMGFRILIYPTTTQAIITEAILDVYGKVRDDGITGMGDERIAALRAKNLEVLGMSRYWAIEERTTERSGDA